MTIAKVTLIQQPNQFVRRGSSDQFFVLILLFEDFQRRREVPHLDGPITVAGQDEPAGTRSHPRGTFTFVNTERRDGGTVDRTNQANALSVRGQPHIELVRVRDHLLHKDLFVVLLAERTKVVASRIAVR